jgi:tetratricopeptide (TPR) repeat protein
LAHRNLAIALQQKGDREGAIAQFRLAVELRPNDDNTWYGLAQANLTAGAPQAYRRVCTDMLKRFGQTKDPGVAARVLYTCLPVSDALSDMTQLLPLAQVAATQKGNTRLLGAALYRAGKYKAAIEPLQQGQARAWDHLFLAMAHHHLGQKEQAREYLERASRQIKTDGYAWPETVESGQLLREAQTVMGLAGIDPDELAVAGLQRTIATAAKEAAAQPDSSDAKGRLAAAHLDLAQLRLGKGQRKAAAEESEKAVMLLPDDFHSLVQHAAILLLAGESKGYRELCAQVLKRLGQTKDTQIGFQVARLCSLAGQQASDPARALQLAEKAVAEQRSSWRVHTLGLAHYRAGSFEQAIKRLNESLAIDAHWQGAFCNCLVLAMAHHRLGQAKEAEQWLNKAARWMDRKGLKPGKDYVGPLFGIHPHDWLEGRVLRGEAEAVLKGKGDPLKDKR